MDLTGVSLRLPHNRNTVDSTRFCVPPAVDTAINSKYDMPLTDELATRIRDVSQPPISFHRALSRSARWRAPDAAGGAAHRRSLCVHHGEHGRHAGRTLFIRPQSLALAENGHSVMIASREMSFLRRVAGHVIFMDHGAIEEEGPSEEVFRHPLNERTQQFLSRVRVRQDHSSISWTSGQSIPEDRLRRHLWDISTNVLNQLQRSLDRHIVGVLVPLDCT